MFLDLEKLRDITLCNIATYAKKNAMPTVSDYKQRLSYTQRDMLTGILKANYFFLAGSFQLAQPVVAMPEGAFFLYLKKFPRMLCESGLF